MVNERVVDAVHGNRGCLSVTIAEIMYGFGFAIGLYLMWLSVWIVPKPYNIAVKALICSFAIFVLIFACVH